MTLWGVAAAVYGLVLAAAAATQPIRRRAVALAGALAYSSAALLAGTGTTSLWINLLVPGALLLSGYWLCGFYFREPQAWLEDWLLQIDHRCRADRWMAGLPRVGQELLELSYALDYVVVGGGAIYAATFGVEAVTAYWSLVLAAELASFASLPWLRSRPPRAIEMPGRQPGEMPGLKPEPAGTPGSAGTEDLGLTPTAGALDFTPDSARAGSGIIMRRLNVAILNRASVQANTIPSGHVSGAVAAALGVWPLDPFAGAGLMVMAVLIAVAAIAGRYHYVVDCVAGATVAVAFWSLM